MANGDAEQQVQRLAAWFQQLWPECDGIRILELDRVDFGHSAEMLALSLVVGSGSSETKRDVVIKLRPPSPGLLEPYDMAKQYRILQGLQETAVRAPRALGFEPTGSVLGREFYVMEHLAGDVFEREVPAELDGDGHIPRMCEGLVDQLVAIHQVDLAGTGLDQLGDPSTFLDRQLDHWAGEMRRVQLGPLPALERLREELDRQRPPASSEVVLVHGDVKPGNFAFVDDEVSAVFDWEMADVGDPMADIGYLELMWGYPVGITSRPTAPTIDAMIERYTARSGREVGHRPWYRAFQAYKTSVILLVGSMLFEAGDTDDMRYLEMALGVDMTTQTGLRDLGIEDQLDPGPVIPSERRIQEAQARASGN